MSSSEKNSSKEPSSKHVTTREVGVFSTSLRSGCYYACRLARVVPFTLVVVNKNNAWVEVCDLVGGQKVIRKMYVRVTQGNYPIEQRTMYSFCPHVFEPGWARKVERVTRDLFIESCTIVSTLNYPKPVWY